MAANIFGLLGRANTESWVEARPPLADLICVQQVDLLVMDPPPRRWVAPYRFGFGAAVVFRHRSGASGGGPL